MSISQGDCLHWHFLIAIVWYPIARIFGLLLIDSNYVCRWRMTVGALKACVLSGGASRRMGSDKALLPHPWGGVWLSHLVQQLRALSLPVVVVSRHASHQRLLEGWSGVEFLVEHPSGLGPLHAFGQLLTVRSKQPLLVTPVDMPLLTREWLDVLIQAWQQNPEQAVVADDGERLQPLLGIYPAADPFAMALRDQLDQGDLRWLRWLERVTYRTVQFPADQLRNFNARSDLAALVDAR